MADDNSNGSRRALDDAVRSRETLDKSILNSLDRVSDDMNGIREDVREVRGEVREVRGEVRQVAAHMGDHMARQAKTDTMVDAYGIRLAAIEAVGHDAAKRVSAVESARRVRIAKLAGAVTAGGGVAGTLAAKLPDIIATISKMLGGG